jgi:hypothetical protein
MENIQRRSSALWNGWSARATEIRGARASRVLVAASRRDELPATIAVTEA